MHRMSHVPGILDVTIGGAELGQLLDGGAACAPGLDGPALEVDVLNSGHLIDAHVSGIADANVDLGELRNSDADVEVRWDGDGARPPSAYPLWSNKKTALGSPGRFSA